jgi:hypothetical protein
MSGKQIYYHFFRKARVELGLPVTVPRPPGLHANEVRKRRGEQFILKLPSSLDRDQSSPLNHFTLSIGQINQSFSNYLKTGKHYNASLISAWDPFANPHGDIPNKVNHERLRDYLNEHKLLHFEAVATGVDHVGWYDGKRPCFVIFNISKTKADQIADAFFQNTYVRVSNPMGFVKLELRQPIHPPYINLKDMWLGSLKGKAHEAAKALSSEAQAQVMALPESEELHWLLPHCRDLHKPWPIESPSGHQHSPGTEWDRLTQLHKAINWEPFESAHV